MNVDSENCPDSLIFWAVRKNSVVWFIMESMAKVDKVAAVLRLVPLPEVSGQCVEDDCDTSSDTAAIRLS